MRRSGPACSFGGVTLRALALALATASAPASGCFLDSQGQPLEGGNSAGGAGAGASGGGGFAEGECGNPVDCGTPAECGAFACMAGLCEEMPAPVGTPCGDDLRQACDGSGVCLGANGATCGEEAECASGFCTDDVCCDTACTDTCSGCAGPVAGTCSVYAADTDADDECADDGVCDGANACAIGTTGASESYEDKSAAWAVSTYANGDALIAGDFEGPVNFGDATTDELPGSGGGGNRDVFVARLSADGTHVWSRGFGKPGLQIAFGTAVASNDTSVVGGQFAGAIDFLDTMGDRTSLGLNDAFVLKLADDGSTVWAKVFGDPLEQAVIGVGVDDDNSVYVAGTFAGTINLGDTDLVSSGGNDQTDVFIGKFTSAGEHVWSKKFGNSAAQFATGFAVNGAGQCAITGEFNGSMTFGGNVLTSLGADVFVAKLDGNGEHVFSSSFGDEVRQHPHAVAIDSLGRVAFAGGYVGNMDLGGDPLPFADDDDVFVGMLSQTGVHVWSHGFSGVGFGVAWGVAIDGSGNVALMGEMEGSAGLGGEPLTSAGMTDVFAAKFSADGTELWSYVYGDDKAQFGNAIAVAPAGDVWLVGHFDGDLKFGTATLQSGGQFDAYFARLEP